MRILTGRYKGKKIIMPSKVRPTQDKVRKALFDILGDIEGLSFLELFAGSGAVGLEAVSRGVKDLTLVEHDRECLRALSKTIEILKTDVCSILPRDAEKAITALHRDKRRFDIIFLDPPYYRDLAKKTLQMLGAYDIVTRNGFIIAQHFKKDTLPAIMGELRLLRQYHYGDTALSVYQKGSR